MARNIVKQPVEIESVKISLEEYLLEQGHIEELPPLEFNVREMREGDWNFVAHSWKRSYRTQKTSWPANFYDAEMQKRLDKLSNRATFLLAVDVEDPDQIFGWACAEDPLLHFVFVKKAFRRQKIATTLIEKLGGPVLCTHWTQHAKKLKESLTCLVNREI